MEGMFQPEKSVLTEGIASLTAGLLLFDPQCHYLSLSIQLQLSSFVAH